MVWAHWAPKVGFTIIYKMGQGQGPLLFLWGPRAWMEDLF